MAKLPNFFSDGSLTSLPPEVLEKQVERLREVCKRHNCLPEEEREQESGE